MEETELTEDALLGGRIRIRQPARGYRVNVDTLLLAAAVEAHAGARLLEAGCGVGAAAIAVAARSANTRCVGVERDRNMADIARENVALNAMCDRVEIVTGDALERSANLGVFDGAFCNPPFHAPDEGQAPAPARRAAHVAETPIDVWIAALADRLKGGAALTLIHKASAAPAVLAALRGRLGGAEMLPVHARADAPASRILVRARKGSRAPFRLWSPLLLHDGGGGKYSARVEAILRGEETIGFG